MTSDITVSGGGVSEDSESKANVHGPRLCEKDYGQTNARGLPAGTLCRRHILGCVGVLCPHQGTVDLSADSVVFGC